MQKCIKNITLDCVSGSVHIESKNESPLKSFLATSGLRRTERDGGIQIQCGRGGWTTIEVKCKVPQRTFEENHTQVP